MSSLPNLPSGAGAATQVDLYNQVFGEGSDVSSLSDSEDEAPRRRLAFPPRPVQRPRSVSGSVPPEDEDRDEDDDVYVPGTMDNTAKIPKFKKVPRRDTAEKMDGDRDVEEKRKRKKKTRRVEGGRTRVERKDEAEAEAEAAPAYDEATREFDAWIRAFLESSS